MRSSSRLALVVLLASFGLLAARSVQVRSDVEETDSADAEFVVPSAVPSSGTGTVVLLVDLDDDSSDATLERIGDEIHAAIAPFDSPDDLPAPLSESAHLYRIETPASEVADLRAALATDEAVEGFEVEGLFELPVNDYAILDIAQDVDSDADADSNADTDDVTEARGPYRPNDPFYKHQWHLDQIQMPAAWRQSQGEGAVVAVIDTGVLFRNHRRARRAPDLAQTHFVDGWDFVDNDNSPDDGHGHGTHVAGTIAQSTNNGIGVAGVAPAARIMPIRVLDDRGAGRYGSVAAGIRWAVDHGANILNLSLGGPTPSSAITNAIQYAHSKGVMVVVAAGNTGRGRVQYPASSPHSFAVGAVRFDEELSFYSSYGRNLDIVAPGGDLRVDQNEDGLPDGVLQNTMVPRNPGRHDYLAYQGTSMAAPHVAGVAALLYANGVTSPDAIERIIRETAKTKSDRRRYGSGLIQASDALTAASRTQGGERGAAAGLLALLFLGLRRKKTGIASAPSESGRTILGIALGAAALAGGAVLSMSLFRGLAVSAGAFWPFLLTAVIPLGSLALLHHKRTGRIATAVLATALGGWLVVEAVSPLLSVTSLGLFAGPWMLVNALLCFGLARLALVPPAR